MKHSKHFSFRLHSNWVVFFYTRGKLAELEIQVEYASSVISCIRALKKSKRVWLQASKLYIFSSEYHSMLIKFITHHTY
jgi:hypothetical protein